VLDLNPRADGTLLATLTLDDIEADWTAAGEVASVSYSDGGTATADALVVEASLLLAVDHGAITVEVANVTATLTGLDMGLPSWADTVLTVLAYDLDAEMEASIEAGIEAEASDALAAALEEALAGLATSEEVAIGDATATVETAPSAVDVDDVGITFSVATTVSLETWLLGRTAAGSLAYGYSAPTWSGTPGALFGFSADFLDQVLYAAWGGGALSLEATDEELGVDMSVVALVLPGLSDLVMVADPLLPPVAVPGATGAMYDLQVGDLLVSMYDGALVPGGEVYQFYVTTVTPLDLEMSGSSLVTSLGTPVAVVDVVLAPSGTDVDALEAVLEGLMPTLLGSVSTLEAEIMNPHPHAPARAPA
jgi:hypothetical protein